MQWLLERVAFHIGHDLSFFFSTFFKAKFGLAALQTDAGEEGLCKWPINVLDCCSVNGAPHPVSHQKSPSA